MSNLKTKYPSYLLLLLHILWLVVSFLIKHILRECLCHLFCCIHVSCVHYSINLQKNNAEYRSFLTLSTYHQHSYSKTSHATTPAWPVINPVKNVKRYFSQQSDVASTLFSVLSLALYTQQHAFAL